MFVYSEHNTFFLGPLRARGENGLKLMNCIGRAEVSGERPVSAPS